MDSRRSTSATRQYDAGFTLIEVLVVLALIGVSAGIVMYALPSSNRARTVDQETALLAARLNLAAERSLINGQHYKLDWRADGYAFEHWQDGEWQAVTDAQLSQLHVLDRGAILTNNDGARRGSLRITPDLLPTEAGPAVLRINADTVHGTVKFDGATARQVQASR